MADGNSKDALENILLKLSLEANTESTEKLKAEGYKDDNKSLESVAEDIVKKFGKSTEVGIFLEEYFTDLFSSQAVEVNREIVRVVERFSEGGIQTMKKVSSYLKSKKEHLLWMYEHVLALQAVRNKYDGIFLLEEGISPLDILKMLDFNSMISEIKTLHFSIIERDCDEMGISSGKTIQILNEVAGSIFRLFNEEETAMLKKVELRMTKSKKERPELFLVVDSFLHMKELGEVGGDLGSLENTPVIDVLLRNREIEQEMKGRHFLSDYYKEYKEDGLSTDVALILTEYRKRIVLEGNNLVRETANKLMTEKKLSSIDAYHNAKIIAIFDRIESKELRSLLDSYLSDKISLQTIKEHFNIWMGLFIDGIEDSEKRDSVIVKVKKGYSRILAVDEYFIKKREGISQTD